MSDLPRHTPRLLPGPLGGTSLERKRTVSNLLATAANTSCELRINRSTAATLTPADRFV
jgi:hypothetical protein